MVKLVFVDMDDTFLSPDKTISAENQRILDLAHEKGVQFVPCTGRNITGLPEQLVSHPCVRYAVCANGAIIADARTGEVLHSISIEKDLVRALYDEVKELPITFDSFADGTVYTMADRWGYLDKINLSEPTREMVKSVRTRWDGSAEELFDQVGDICRVNVFYLDRADAVRVWDAVDVRPELTRASSLPCNVEITRAEATKGTGVRWLCEYLGVSLADVVAFGDSDNDLTMLEVAGDGVAMGNANAVAKASADHVCGTCAESGVARYLEPLLRAQ